MTIDTLRQVCRELPGVTEDVKWGNDLCFSVGGKMFAAVDLNPPHSLGFKCTAEDFGELVERPGVGPAPYLARAMWVKEDTLGGALHQTELRRLLKSAYDLVVAKLPKSKRPGVEPAASSAGSSSRRKPSRQATGRKAAKPARKSAKSARPTRQRARRRR